MANQNSFRCSVCGSGEALVAYVAREIGLRHSYARIAQATGLSKSSLHRHIHRCVPRRAAFEYKQNRVPDHFHLRVNMPDGREIFHEGINPFDRFRGTQSELPTLEVDCIFESPVALPVPREVAPADMPSSPDA